MVPTPIIYNFTTFKMVSRTLLRSSIRLIYFWMSWVIMLPQYWMVTHSSHLQFGWKNCWCGLTSLHVAYIFSACDVDSLNAKVERSYSFLCWFYLLAIYKLISYHLGVCDALMKGVLVHVVYLRMPCLSVLVVILSPVFGLALSLWYPPYKTVHI